MRALDGSGATLQPVAAGSADIPPLSAGVLGEGEDDTGDPTALVVGTSGSTGTAKLALLPASALLASARATHARLGGPGSWLLALPPHHIAGLQVLVRSLDAGTSPVVLDLTGGFQPDDFVAAAGRVTDQGPRYTALVPTQLLRLLDSADTNTGIDTGGAATAALRSFDAVLVGGAATATSLLQRARDAGVRAVPTYGMSETCGGCVYDGRSLDRLRVRTDGEGRVYLAGPVLARGYLSDPERTAAAFSIDSGGTRWFRTDDLGEVRDDGALHVLGRVDDVITTGGLKVNPAVVEAALAALPGVAHAVVVGVPDPQWGETVVAIVVPDPGAGGPSLDRLRAQVAASVAPFAAPTRMLLVERLPLRGPGKPDRAALSRLAAASTAPSTADG